MRVSSAYRGASVEELKAALAGGRLEILACQTESVLGDGVADDDPRIAVFRFKAPAFGPDAADGLATPRLRTSTVSPLAPGRPAVARAYDRDGVPVVDLTAGDGFGEVKLTASVADPTRLVGIATFRFGAVEAQAWTTNLIRFGRRPPGPPARASAL